MPNAHEVIIDRFEKFIGRVTAAHNYLEANQQNQDERYADIQTWMNNVQSDTDTSNSICLSTRTAQIDALLP